MRMVISIPKGLNMVTPRVDFETWTAYLHSMIVDVIIPALNEAQSIGHVLAGLRDASIRTVIVVDNGSTDGTDEIARAAGATIVYEPRRGYGQACLAGLAHLSLDPPDAVLFLDGDGADDPEDIPKLLAPLRSGQADFVVGF